MNENNKAHELNEEQLKDVSGGEKMYGEKDCPACQAKGAFIENDWRDGRTCSKCGYTQKY